MTRINCIPVEELENKMLISEYRELPRISKLAKVVADAPANYKLGTGHVKFFYDKGLYLQKRFSQLVSEMQRRGFTTNFTTYRPHPDGLNNDWTPGPTDMEINRQRIKERLTSIKQRDRIKTS